MLLGLCSSREDILSHIILRHSLLPSLTKTRMIKIFTTRSKPWINGTIISLVRKQSFILITILLFFSILNLSYKRSIILNGNPTSNNSTWWLSIRRGPLIVWKIFSDIPLPRHFWSWLYIVLPMKLGNPSMPLILSLHTFGMLCTTPLSWIKCHF